MISMKVRIVKTNFVSIHTHTRTIVNQPHSGNNFFTYKEKCNNTYETQQQLAKKIGT